MDIPNKVLKNRNRVPITPSERNICEKKYFYNGSKSRITRMKKAIRKKYKDYDSEGYNR